MDCAGIGNDDNDMFLRNAMTFVLEMAGKKQGWSVQAFSPDSFGEKDADYLLDPNGSITVLTLRKTNT